MNTSYTQSITTTKIIGIIAVGAALLLSLSFALPTHAFASTGDSHSSDSDMSWQNSNGSNSDWNNDSDSWKNSNGTMWWEDCSQTMWSSHKDWWGPTMTWEQWTGWCMMMRTDHHNSLNNQNDQWDRNSSSSSWENKNNNDEWNSSDRNDNEDNWDDGNCGDNNGWVSDDSQDRSSWDNSSSSSWDNSSDD